MGLSILQLREDAQEAPGAEDSAFKSPLRSQRPGAMRTVLASSVHCDRVRRDVLVRNAPDGLRTDRNMWSSCADHASMQAGSEVNARTERGVCSRPDRPVMIIDIALDRGSAVQGLTLDRMDLCDFLPPDAAPQLCGLAPEPGFVATFELVRSARAVIAREEIDGEMSILRGTQ